MLDVKIDSSSKCFQLLDGQIEKSRADLDEYQILLQKLQVLISFTHVEPLFKLSCHVLLNWLSWVPI